MVDWRIKLNMRTHPYPLQGGEVDWLVMDYPLPGGARGGFFDFLKIISPHSKSLLTADYADNADKGVSCKSPREDGHEGPWPSNIEGQPPILAVA